MASRYPTAWMDELCSRADIVQVVSSYVPLKKNGHRYWGLCPFHGEKTASFSVSADPPLFYCFGCKMGGNVIKFVMEMEHLEFSEAVRHLAEQVHMALPQMENDEDYQRRRSQRERLLAANKEAARFYHEMLFKPEGASCLAYLRKRGLTDSTIRKFGLGASPDEWDACTRYLTEKGYTTEELQLCGLTVVKDAEPATQDTPAKPKRVFDMFRNRPMFPIIDQFGNVLGFGGRSQDGKQPKYMNTSDTPVFNKRKNVFAANLLKKERHLDRVILVEGYMDVISLTQHGVSGVCATLGTALTNEQAQLLHRFAPKVYLAYDGDSAGQHAILRGLDILSVENVPARVLDFPEGLDPDEFVNKYGLEGFTRLPVITGEEYRMRRLKEEFDLSTQEGRTDYARASAKILKGLEPIEQENLLRKLMIETGFTREVLLQQINISVPVVAESQQITPARPTAYRRRDDPAQSEEIRAQEMLISLTATGRLPDGVLDESDFSDELLADTWKALSSGLSVNGILTQTDNEESLSRLTRILLSPTSDNTDEIITMANDCVNSLRRKKLEARLAEIMKEINSLPPNKKDEALNEARAISARITQLKNCH